MSPERVNAYQLSAEHQLIESVNVELPPDGPTSGPPGDEPVGSLEMAGGAEQNAAEVSPLQALSTSGVATLGGGASEDGRDITISLHVPHGRCLACPLCAHTFTTRKNHKRHVAEIHRRRPVVSFSCRVCGHTDADGRVAKRCFDLHGVQPPDASPAPLFQCPYYRAAAPQTKVLQCTKPRSTDEPN